MKSKINDNVVKLNLRRISKALKNSPEILLESKFKIASSLILLTKIKDEYFVILEKRAKKIRQGGEISLPGGIFDPKKDNNFLTTALRETEEELGIDKSKIKTLGKNSIFIAPNGIIIHTFVGFINYSDAKNSAFNKKEVEDIFFAPLVFFKYQNPKKYYAALKIYSSLKEDNGEDRVLFPAKKLGLPERYWESWGEGKYEILLYKYNDEFIWGITAKILKNFVSKIFD